MPTGSPPPPCARSPRRSIDRRFQDPRLRVDGRTDAKGDDAYNQALSERRAAAVKAWLAGNARIPADHMGTRGYGETRPVAPNAKPDGADDPAGRQRNRRVEIAVAAEG